MTAPLAWYTSLSADDADHDQEVDLDAIGSPGGASWASVATDGRPGRQPWAWVIYNRWWIGEDEDPDPVIACGETNSEEDAKAAVAAWVKSQGGPPWRQPA